MYGLRVALTSFLVLGIGSEILAADPGQNVKALTDKMSGTKRLKGVVEKIDKDALVLVVTLDGGQGAEEHRLVPIDVLRHGGTLREVIGAFAYRWQDVKPGDSVALITMEDEKEKQLYCTEICIERRPGAKLPQSQNPKDDRRYAAARIFNDIDNGEDVSDEDWENAFPVKFMRDPKTGQRIPVPVDSTTCAKYREKLDAIRAKKKEQELKATPPKTADKK
jgi:hypothetical protein